MGTYGYTFLGFIAVAVLLYLAAPARWRQGLVVLFGLLYAASYGPGTLLPLLALFLANHLLAGRIAASRPARAWLVAAIAADLGCLALFKYADLVLASVPALNQAAPARWVAGLPEFAGLSYLTFSVLAYQIDLWRGQTSPAPARPLAAYMLFFPKFVAGPIVRPAELMTQLRTPEVALNAERFERGLLLIAAGMAKKFLVADQLAGAIGRGFKDIEGLSFLASWLVMWAYAVQIYMDFSGYTDIARGLARLFGFELPRNFKSPYVAGNASEFWSRWHMSLSRWFRDYVYIPLGGSRMGSARTYANLVVTMSLCGLWHGAAWTFVAWGAYHGLLMAATHLWRRIPESVLPRRVRASRGYRAAAVLLTFQLVTVGWVFFRAGSFRAAGKMLSAMAGLHGLGLSRGPIKASDAALIAAALAGAWIFDRVNLARPLARVPWPVRVAAATAIVFFTLIARVPGGEFIYGGF